MLDRNVPATMGPHIEMVFNSDVIQVFQTHTTFHEMIKLREVCQYMRDVIDKTEYGKQLNMK
ncbi:hypothetical protein AQUSIP_11250 [Aquicella siphonis]|uniref:Uncharacterized protein n=1 Tax=Aquicella siphonis TaxID=254247 RepID=A0A5E4PH33_9COXI|nr:hypothetical protein [Aquicella siphonis]VVC75828.1 hypothetical protein AQUSIP_11250 [Aquicella siphonis]